MPGAAEQYLCDTVRAHKSRLSNLILGHILHLVCDEDARVAVLKFEFDSRFFQP